VVLLNKNRSGVTVSGGKGVAPYRMRWITCGKKNVLCCNDDMTNHDGVEYTHASFKKTDAELQTQHSDSTFLFNWTQRTAGETL